MPRLAVSMGHATESAKTAAKRDQRDVLVVRASKVGRFGIRDRFRTRMVNGVTEAYDSLLQYRPGDVILVVRPDGSVVPAAVERSLAAAKARP